MISTQAMTDPILILRVLLLLGAANGAPILASRLLRERWDAPLDGGRTWRDGRPILGSSKTFRGILAAAVCTAGIAPLLGFSAWTGLAVAAGAMTGDLLSSFAKRRLGLPAHARASGIDQVPEALLPLLLLRPALGLSVTDILVALLAFIILAVLLSRLLYRLNIRDRPY